MTPSEIYNIALDVAVQMVLNEDGNLNLSRIAQKMGLSLDELKACISDRKQFSAQVSVRLGAKIWAREGEIFGKVIESPQYQALNGAGQVRELFRSSFLYSFRGHPDFWRWLHRFEQFVVSEKIPAESMSEYADQLASFYPIFYRAFEKGLGDGSIRPEVNPADYYAAVAQALLTICIKFCSAPILSSDTSDAGERQINTIIDMATYYLKR